MAKHRAGLALGILVLLTTLPAFPSEELRISEGRFPLLNRVSAEGAKLSIDEISRDALLDEIAVERLLWQDDLDRLRVRAAGSGEALSRIDRVQAEIMRKMETLEDSISRGSLDNQLLSQILSSGSSGADRSLNNIISGGGLRLPEPVHRQVTLRRDLPVNYWDQPSAEYKTARSKAADVVDPVSILAQSLDSDPVALYQYVLHEIRPVNAFGHSRSPEAVLNAGAGSGADQALLLADLYRASGYPARVVWGVQELSAAALVDHFGLQGPQLENALTTGGYAWSPVVEAGQNVAYRISRVWCEVWIGFVDFRGVVLDQSGSTWLPLDPWIKGYESWDDRRILEEMDLDGSDLRQRFFAGEFCAGDLNDAGACSTLEEALVSEVEAYQTLHGETEAFSQLAADRTSALAVETILPAAMVGPIVAVDGFGIDLPQYLRFRVNLRATDGMETLLDVDLDVADLSTGEAAIWFEPATAADIDVVEALGGYLWNVPPYLVNVAPVVLIGQEVIARGEGSVGIGMGASFQLELTMTTPAGSSWTWSNAARAGVPVGLGIAAGRQGYETPYEEPASTLQSLSKLASTYLDDVAAFEQQLASIDHLTVVHRMPSTVMISSVVEAVGSLGFVIDLEWQGIQIDADIWGSEVAGGEITARKRWRDLARLNASTLERRLFEYYDVTSVSADMALILAQAQGVPVLHIDQSNLASALQQLPFEVNIESEIEAWVVSGGEADVPVAPLDFVEWSGVGYVLTDPETGESKYQLAGSLSGGMTVLPPGFEVEGIPGHWPPTYLPGVDDPMAATTLEIRLGLNGQIGRAGSEAGVLLDGAPRTKPFQVALLNEDSLPVEGVEVTFEIAIGEGHFINEEGATVTEILVTTDHLGIAGVRFVYDESTGTIPFYTQLSPVDDFMTRVGANRIRVTTAPVSFSADIWAFSAPGPLHEADATNDQWSTTPEMLGGRAQVVARDALGNPIANAMVGVRILSGGGALLTSEEFNTHVLAQGGEILLQDISDPQVLIQDLVTVSDGKVATYPVLGPPPDGEVEILFFVSQRALVRSDTTTMAKVSPDDGTILYSWSARPTGSWGQWIEGYHPGTEIYRPMVLDLFEVENGIPVRAPADELRARFQPTSGCPEGTVLLNAPIVDPPLKVGQWAISLQLGTTPGRCELIATIDEYQADGTWESVLTTGPSASVWAVKMELQAELPLIVVGVEHTPVEDQLFQYSILPMDYYPERTAIVFAAGGPVVGMAEGWLRGDGELSMQPGSVELDPEMECTVQGVLNPGVFWGQGTANPLDLKVAFEPQELEVVTAKVHIAMDGNRDDEIKFDDSEDQRYLFWVNDDHDVMHHNEGIYQEDDMEGSPDCDDDAIGGYHYLEPDPIDDPFGKPDRCKRDLEDFTRLQFQADENAAELSDLVYSVRFESDTDDDPAANIFEAQNCALDYLEDADVADSQIEAERLVTVLKGREDVIESQYISSDTPKSCFILEGKSAGLGSLTLIVRKNGIVLSEESVELDLKPIAYFYDRFVVREIEGDTVEDRISETTRADYSPETNEYVLFVHGWNVDDWTKDRWTETIFKRLWWLGYKGQVGSFQWPNLGLSSYNRSELRSWRSAGALTNLIGRLDSDYPGQIRMIAHSQGNVVAGEALRQSSTVINSYIATQGAVSARIYDNSVPRFWFPVSTPDLYGFYSTGVPPSVPYFGDVVLKAGKLFRYYNRSDFALRGWVVNNVAKPLFPSYFFNDFDGDVDTYSEWDLFFYDGPFLDDERDLVIPENKYEIFSHCAESRSLALGAVDSTVGGFESETNLADFGFDGSHYSHSREFRSNIVDESLFWEKVADDFGLTFNNPEE